MTGVSVEAIAGTDLRLEPFEWPFAADRRPDIDRHWQALEAEKPGIWNGAIVLTRKGRIEGDCYRGTCFVTDYASFVAWRAWGWPDPEIVDCFGAALVLSRDGALLYGRMAGSTLNAGHVYPPSGSIDLEDVTPEGRINVEGSLVRELAEETGLAASEARPGQLWAVRDGCRMCLARELWFDEDAERLGGRIEAFNAAQAHPELDGVVILRSPPNGIEGIPPYAEGIAHHLLERER